jgi:transcriptional regulator with AAA-type ATPase domain
MFCPVGRFAEIADHFRRRSISLGQDGYFGSLFTYNLRLRGIYSALASLIDNPNLSFVLEGARGTGKSRIAQEFLRLENISRNLHDIQPTRFVKVDANSRYDILLGLYQKDIQLTPSFFYFPKLEDFSVNEQELLSRILRRQDYREQNYRVVVSCEESLVFMIQRGKILSSLVECLKLHTFSIPRLSERSDDLPAIVLDIAQRYGAKKQTPSQKVIDLLTRIDYPENIDSLAGLIKSATVLNASPSSWTVDFIEKIYPLAKPERTENILDFRERFRYQ